jgi:hypothetical protein
MCQASILRFCCGHGLVMSLDPCKLGPCPFIKTNGSKIPQQPFKCYNCQQKRTSALNPRCPTSRESSSISSNSSLGSVSSTSPYGAPANKLQRVTTAPLPGVALQPAGTLRYCHSDLNRPRSASKPFSFACSSSSHYATEHYLLLPGYLPHQDHACPPCQVEDLRRRGDREAILLAKKEFPNLRGEMLVRNGRIREDWESNLTLEKYIDEKRTDEKQMWLHVIRKWTQDLRKIKVLLSEEDGLSLMS